MYCKKCGAEIEDNSVYCPECGVKIRNKEEIPEAPYSYKSEESGINDPLWEPENNKKTEGSDDTSKRIRWLAGGLLGVVVVAAAGILSWKILKPSEPDPTEPTVKIGEAVAEIKSEGSDKNTALSNKETGKQENTGSKDDVSVALSPESEADIPVDEESTLSGEEGLSKPEEGILTSKENTPELESSELTEDENTEDPGVDIKLNEEKTPENSSEQNSASGGAFILEAAEPDLTSLKEAGVITANATSTFAQPDADHSPILLFDKKDNTFWQEGTEGPGKGESVSFGLDDTYQIQYLGFKLGNWTDDQRYAQGSKPKTVTLTAGGSFGQVTFDGDKKVEWVKVDPPVTADTVLLKINDVYTGASEDTCITEIMIYGNKTEGGK